MTDDERQAAHEKSIRFVQALGREVQRTEARDGDAARDEILAGLAGGLPSRFLGQILQIQLDLIPQASVELADTIPAEQARSLHKALVETGKLSKDDILDSLAAKWGIPVDELKKRLGL